MRKQRNTLNEKTDVVQKKGRRQRKTGTVPQVIDGGGTQVGTCERPGRCQPSPLRRMVYFYICNMWGKRNERANARGVFIIVGTVLRLEKEAWSTVK